MLGAVRKAARRPRARAADALAAGGRAAPGRRGAHAALATRAPLSPATSAGARRASDEAERRRVADQRERAAVVMTAVGIARLDAGDAEAARERFAAAIAVAEAYAPAHYHLGRALQRLGRLDEARAAFARRSSSIPSLVSPLDAR